MLHARRKQGPHRPLIATTKCIKEHSSNLNLSLQLRTFATWRGEIIHYYTKMKIIICLVLCAFVATTYAAPTTLEDAVGRLLLAGLKSREQQQANRVQVMDDDDDDDMALIEGWFGKAFKKAKNLGKKVAPYAKKGYDLYRAANGGVEAQDDDDDDRAEIEALIQSLKDRAELESFWSTLGKIGKTALGVIGKKWTESQWRTC